MEATAAIIDNSIELEMPVLETILERRSGRAFSDRSIESEKIQSLFEAARWAPSSSNEQPWTYIYATKGQPELWGRLFDALVEGNRIWAEKAPLLILSMVRKNFIWNDKPNGSASYDLGAANALLSLQATHLGLNVHQMGGFDRERARVNLNVPDSHVVVVMIAVGYLGDPRQLPDNLKQRELAPRERYTRKSFVMNKTF